MLVTLLGSEFNDFLLGSDGDDDVLGFSGNDAIDARNGNDVINGNQGDDTLKGGDGNDFIHGGKGKDLIEGANGNDTVTGDLGAGIVWGGTGADIFMFSADSATENLAFSASDFNSSLPLIAIDRYAFVADFNPDEGDRILITDVSQDDIILVYSNAFSANPIPSEELLHGAIEASAPIFQVTVILDIQTNFVLAIVGDRKPEELHFL